MPRSPGSPHRSWISRSSGRICCTINIGSLARRQLLPLLRTFVGTSSVVCTGRSHGGSESHGRVAAGVRRPPGGASGASLRGASGGCLLVQLRAIRRLAARGGSGLASTAGHRDLGRRPVGEFLDLTVSGERSRVRPTVV